MDLTPKRHSKVIDSTFTEPSLGKQIKDWIKYVHNLQSCWISFLLINFSTFWFNNNKLKRHQFVQNSDVIKVNSNIIFKSGFKHAVNSNIEVSHMHLYLNNSGKNTHRL